MSKLVEISLEAFGNRRLTTKLQRSDVDGKSVGQIIDTLMTRTWEGEDKRTLAILQREMQASNRYTPSVAYAQPGKPIKFQPVRLDDPITPYVPIDENVRIAVTGNHSVGHSVGSTYNI